MLDEHTANVCAIRRPSDGYYWQSNMEHGSGWTTRIRQTWTVREARLVVQKLFEQGWVQPTDIEILEVEPIYNVWKEEDDGK